MTSFTTLEQVFFVLSQGTTIKIDEVSQDLLKDLALYGIQVLDREISLPEGVELIDRSFIKVATTSLGWVKRLEVETFIESTNTKLVDRAQTQSIDGHVLLAEVQFGGRGRRGRSWMSPFARNLAVSLGMKLRRPAAEMGSFSLVVGLAVADVLREVGIVELSLKWPNDVLLSGRKVCGVLIELVRLEQSFEVVIGFGINIGAQSLIVDAIEQRVADITEQAPNMSRNKLAALILNKIVRYGQQFAKEGFFPFRNRWQQLNYYQDKEVEVSMPRKSVTGTCVGVNEIGCLLVDEGSRVIEIYAGDVSLRGLKDND